MSYSHLMDAYTPRLISLDKAQPIPATSSSVPSPLQLLTALSAPCGSHGQLCRPQDPVPAQAATTTKPRSPPTLNGDPCLPILGMSGQHNMAEG